MLRDSHVVYCSEEQVNYTNQVEPFELIRQVLIGFQTKFRVHLNLHKMPTDSASVIKRNGSWLGISESIF